jgi:NAD+ kinase
MPARQPAKEDLLDPRAVRCVGIIAAMHKRRIASAVQDVVAWLKKRRIEARLPEEQASSLSLPELATPLAELARCSDLVVSMGGDGTLLAAARLAAPLGKPVLGVNLGGFGFLASVPAGPGLSKALENIFRAPSPVQRRMMLEAVVRRGRDMVGSFLALNDIVVGKGAFSRLFRLKTSVSGEPISYFPADGIIVATPTGSTGYSLSAGGPVVDPEVRAIILTPICAHTLTARTLVVPADRVIEMVLPDLQGEEVNLTADGQEGFSLRAGDVIAVREARFPARLIVLSESSFYRRLRAKLGWGSHR